MIHVSELYEKSMVGRTFHGMQMRQTLQRGAIWHGLPPRLLIRLQRTVCGLSGYLRARTVTPHSLFTIRLLMTQRIITLSLLGHSSLLLDAPWHHSVLANTR